MRIALILVVAVYVLFCGWLVVASGLFGGSLLNFKYAVHRLRVKGIGAKSIQATGWKGDNTALSDNSRGVLNYTQVRIFRTYFK